VSQSSFEQKTVRKKTPLSSAKSSAKPAGPVVFAAQDMLPNRFMSDQDTTASALPNVAGSLTHPKRRGLGAHLSEGLGLSGWMRLRTLILIRWIAVLGQAATVLFASEILHLPVPLWPCLAVIGLSTLANLFLTVNRHGAARLGDRAAAFYLAYDLLQLSALLYLTGGLENPFSILILAPITVSASILSTRSTIWLTVFAVCLASLLALFYLPPPFSSHNTLFGHQLSAIGLWSALSLTAIFIAIYVWHVTADARNMSTALTATQMALAREQRLSSMGALAAAVAHELGSPLGAIVVTAKDLESEMPQDSPYREDIDMIVSQGERCREILTELARGEPKSGTSFIPLPLSALVEEAAEPYQSDHIPVVIERLPYDKDSGPEPKAPYLPEIRHAVATLVENATQFAQHMVEVTITWDQKNVEIIIQDDGPGFSAEMLDRLGEPYISGRKGEDSHMGLGVFIAQTLLNRTGASVAFSNIVSESDYETHPSPHTEKLYQEEKAFTLSSGAKVSILWEQTTLNSLAERQRQQDNKEG